MLFKNFGGRSQVALHGGCPNPPLTPPFLWECLFPYIIKLFVFANLVDGKWYTIVVLI